MFTKNKRIVDPELLSFYRGATCMACGKKCSTDPAHIKTRGAHGDDVDDNLMALCRYHHTEQGQIGWYTFSQKYPVIAKILQSKGWSFNNYKKLERI